MSTVTNSNGKRDRDSLVIAALARGASYADAARVAGVSLPRVPKLRVAGSIPVVRSECSWLYFAASIGEREFELD
jgi:hypothetical protein